MTLLQFKLKSASKVLVMQKKKKKKSKSNIVILYDIKVQVP